MRWGIEWSADEILGEPDDQVVVHARPHAFAERALALPCACRRGDYRAVRASAEPGRTRRTGQQKWPASRCPDPGLVLGRIHQQRRNAAPPPRFAHRDLADQRDAAAPESGVVGLPYDRDGTDGIGTTRGDEACTVWFRVIGQVPSRLGLAVTDPLNEDPRPSGHRCSRTRPATAQRSRRAQQAATARESATGSASPHVTRSAQSGRGRPD